MGFPFSPRPMGPLPPGEVGKPASRNQPRTVSALSVIPWRSASFSAANVGQKSPYRYSYSFSTVALTHAAIRRFDGFPRPRCASPWSPAFTCVNCCDPPPILQTPPYGGEW